MQKEDIASAIIVVKNKISNFARHVFLIIYHNIVLYLLGLQEIRAHLPLGFIFGKRASC